MRRKATFPQKDMKSLLKEDNTSEMVRMLLKHAKKYDFGKNWMEEIDTTL